MKPSKAVENALAKQFQVHFLKTFPENERDELDHMDIDTF